MNTDEDLDLTEDALKTEAQRIMEATGLHCVQIVGYIEEDGDGIIVEGGAGFLPARIQACREFVSICEFYRSTPNTDEDGDDERTE